MNTPQESTGQGGEMQDQRFSRRKFLAAAGGVAALAAGTSGCLSSIKAGEGINPPGPKGKPKRGGHFKIGITGGGAQDMYDGQNIVTEPDQARLVSQFETLLTYNTNFEITNDGLAESVVQDNPKQWTIRLRQGIEFNNGKTMTADDVIFSIQRLFNPKLGLPGAEGNSSINPKALQKMDKWTVRMHLKEPDSTIDQLLAGYTNTIVPVGYKKWPAKQVGTGAFELVSFTPGEQSYSVRNPNYWRSGQPYFDELTIIDYPDSTAQVNALLSGQIHAMTDLPAAQVPVAVSHGGLAVLVSKTGAWTPLCMAINMPPFDNNDLRQALRYCVDRTRTVEQVTSGYGRVANDLFSPFDPDYDSSIPQRPQDLDKAKYLLKKAGMEHAKLTLHTTNGAAGMVEIASVFATQASAVGIDVQVQNDPDYYGNQYLKLPFSVDFWGTRSYLAQVAQGMLPTSPFNETHWPPKNAMGEKYQSLYKQALGTTSASLRKEFVHEMQKMEFDYGGYIIPDFRDLVDCYDARIGGFHPDKGTLNLMSYGNGFRSIWFS